MIALPVDLGMAQGCVTTRTAPATAQTPPAAYSQGACRQLSLGTSNYATCACLSLSWCEAARSRVNICLAGEMGRRITHC